MVNVSLGVRLPQGWDHVFGIFSKSQVWAYNMDTVNSTRVGQWGRVCVSTIFSYLII